MTRNAFEALCERASRERWLVRLDGGPAGTGLVRAGFGAILAGFHPDARDWPVHRTLLDVEPVAMPADGARLESQFALMRAVCDASLVAIAHRARAGVWIGAFAVLLRCVRDAEARLGRLTASFAPQLARMCVHSARELRDELEAMPANGQRLDGPTLARVGPVLIPWLRMPLEDFVHGESVVVDRTIVGDLRSDQAQRIPRTPRGR